MKTDNLKPVLGILVISALITFWGPLAAICSMHPAAPDFCLTYSIFTCHLAHWGLDHFLYDALALAILGFMTPRKHVFPLLAWSAVCVSLAVILFHPELEAYRGLSGIDCAFFSYCALSLWKRNKAVSGFALAALLAKTFWELHSGGTVFAQGDFVPVHAAHLAGIFAGAVFFVALLPRRRKE